MTLINPFGLLGLASLLVLGAIYLFRSRSQRLTVSSLFLWNELEPPHSGGRTTERMPLPLSFYLEALALALLSLAIARPTFPSWTDRRPLVVILDDSFSMKLASGEARARAIKFLGKELLDPRYESIDVIRAGIVLETLVRRAGHTAAIAALERWSCASPRADIERAVRFASQNAGAEALIVVISDHTPAIVPNDGRTQWRSFGEPAPRVAIVNAHRNAADQGERCLLEITNFSQVAAHVRFKATLGEQPITLAPLELAAGARQQLAFDVPRSIAPLHLALDVPHPDLDQHVLLLPERRPVIRARIALTDPALAASIQTALGATQRVNLTTGPSDLVVSDHDVPTGDGEWLLTITASGKTTSFLGPFVLDTTHPLTRGLTLNGVIWSRGMTAPAGHPVILLGDHPVVTDDATAQRRIVRIDYDMKQSTFDQSPAWPALWWNVATWRGAGTIGPEATNLRAGQTTALRLPDEKEVAVIEAPSGAIVRRSGATTITLPADELGLWHVRVEDRTFDYAVNALDASESDLRESKKAVMGSWKMREHARRTESSFSWLFALLAAAALVIHLFIIRRGDS